MLKPDMRKKLEQELGINTDEIERQLCNAANPLGDAQDASGEPESGVPQSGTSSDLESGQDTDFQGGFNANGNTDSTQDELTNRHNGDDLGDSDSGFGLNGKEACWTPKKFWNFVDYMLRQLHASVWRNAAPTDDVDKLIGEYVLPLIFTPPCM